MKNLIILIIIAFSTSLFAQSGGEGGAFLKNGFGARANSMGNAFSGVANDVSAVYYNPAGLSQLTKSEGMLMYSKLFNNIDGLTYGNMAFAQPFAFGTIAIGVAYMKVSDIPNVPSSSGPDGTTFNDNQVMVMGSYSRKINEYFTVAGSLKFINHSLAGYSASGFGLDIGIFSNINEYVTAGIAFQDILQPKINLNSSEYKYPFKAKIGFGVYPIKDLILAPEIDIAPDKDAVFGIGGEYSLFKKILSIRAGYNTLYSSVSFGAGVNYKGVGFDYSFNTHSDLGSVSKFGLIVKLDLLK